MSVVTDKINEEIAVIQGMTSTLDTLVSKLEQLRDFLDGE